MSRIRIVSVLSMLVSVLFGSCLLFIEKPNIEIPNQNIYAGETVTLDLEMYVSPADADYSYQLKAGCDGELDGSIYTFTPLQPGEYEVTLYVSNGLKDDGCTFIITVEPGPQAALLA